MLTVIANAYWRLHQGRLVRRCQRVVDELMPEVGAQRLLRQVFPVWERHARDKRMRRWHDWLVAARARLEAADRDAASPSASTVDRSTGAIGDDKGTDTPEPVTGLTGRER